MLLRNLIPSGSLESENTDQKDINYLEIALMEKRVATAKVVIEHHILRWPRHQLFLKCST